jgi:protein-tyrosine-phosphatase
MRRRVTLIAVAAVCVLAAACGSDDNGSGATAESQRLTKEEYIAQADAICQEADAKIDAVPEPQSTEELAEYGEQVVEVGQEQLDRLRALRPPQADETTINEAYDLIEQQLAIANDLVDAAREGELEQVQELLAQGEQLNDQADQIAADYGLTECGSS